MAKPRKRPTPLRGVYSNTRGQFIQNNGQFIGPLQVRAILDDDIAGAGARLGSLAGRYLSGEMTREQWREAHALELKGGHLAGVALGRGGAARLTPADYGFAGAALKKQYGYLARFDSLLADLIRQNPDRLSDPAFRKMVERRAASYAQAIRTTFEAVRFKEAKKSGAKWARRILHASESCFVVGTQILTANGCKPIEEIQVGDLVMTRRGLRPVTRLYKRKYEGELLKVCCSGQEVICTPNHPFLTERGWQDAQNLRDGEQVVLAKNADGYGFGQVAFPNSYDLVAASRQVFSTRSVTFLLRDLTGVERMVARVPVPPVAIKFDNQLTDANVYNEVGLDKNVVFISNSQLIKHDLKSKFQFARLILLQTRLAFHQLCVTFRPRFSLLSQAFACPWHLGRVMLTHLLRANIEHQAAPRFRCQADFQTIGLTAHAAQRITKFFRYPRRAALRIMSAQKINVRLAPGYPAIVTAVGAKLGVIGFASSALRADGAPPLAAHATNRNATLSDVPTLRARFAAWARSRMAWAAVAANRLSAPPRMRAVRADMVKTRPALRLSSIHQGELYHKARHVYNLEVGGEHEYVANGFVVHNCGGCANAAGKWVPIDEMVPIGGFECNVHCRCTIQYSNEGAKMEEVPSKPSKEVLLGARKRPKNKGQGSQENVEDYDDPAVLKSFSGGVAGSEGIEIVSPKLLREFKKYAQPGQPELGAIIDRRTGNVLQIKVGEVDEVRLKGEILDVPDGDFVVVHSHDYNGAFSDVDWDGFVLFPTVKVGFVVTPNSGYILRKTPNFNPEAVEDVIDAFETVRQEIAQSEAVRMMPTNRKRNELTDELTNRRLAQTFGAAFGKI